MSTILTNPRSKRLSSMGGASLQTQRGSVSSTMQQPTTTQTQQSEPVVFELADVESEDENGKFLSKQQPSPVSVQQPSPIPENPSPNPPHSTPPKKNAFKKFCRRLYQKFGMKYVITILMIVLYTIIGAVVFLAIEKNADIQRLENAFSVHVKNRLDFARNLSYFVFENRDRWGDIPELERLIDSRLQLYDDQQGCTPSRETQWSFGNAMYFAGTIYTTIGYGDIFCRTKTGRIMTMLYSLVGIPLMLITLTDLGGLLLKFMFAVTQFCDRCKAKYSPAALFGPHPPGYDEPMTKYKRKSEPDMGSKIEIMEKGGKTDEEDDMEDLYEMEKKEDEDYEYQLMRIRVSTALLTTVGWIFICAGLFCIWEDWDYFDSVYFFFISLSTIGLGDVTPDRKDIMVATYLFVIIGLSLVSMTITVIQRRLEELYLQLLKMILQEYQRKLMQGNDQMGATVGMMQAWKKSKAARFLMPLLSKDKKKTVAKKFQDEAKAQGIVLPAVLRDLDPRSGIPTILRVAERKIVDSVAQLNQTVGNVIQRATAKAKALNEPVDEDFGFQNIYGVEEGQEPQRRPTLIAPAPVSVPILYDADAQTDELETEDKQEQTLATPHADAQTQSHDSSFASKPRVDEASQTPVVEYDEASTQCKLEEQREPTPKPTGTEEETQTDLIELSENSSQTSKTLNKDKEIQTHVYELTVVETQTEPVQTKNQRLQTPIPEIMEQEAQTDPLILDPELFQASSR